MGFHQHERPPTFPPCQMGEGGRYALIWDLRCTKPEISLLLAIHLVSGYSAPWWDHNILKKANLGPLDTLDYHAIWQI